MTTAVGSLAAVVTLALAGALPSAGADAPGGLPVYSAGERVDGLELKAVLRRDDTASYVSFVYGDCRPTDDAGCAPPAEVQVWPACSRSLALYRTPARPGPEVEAVAVRGVPAAFLDEGTRLELQTGEVTVVVFAGSRERVLRIVGELRALDGSVTSGAPLPPPTPAALEGAGRC